VRTQVVAADGGLVLRQTATAQLIGDDEHATHEYPLRPVAEDLFVLRAPGTVTWVPVTFYTLEDGSPYLHYGARANPKQS